MGILEPFEKVYSNYQPLLKKLAYRYSFMNGYEECYAIASAALYEAYLHYDSSKGSFAAYVKTFVRGKLLHDLRKEIRYRNHHVLPNQREEEENWEESIPDEHNVDPFELSDDFMQALERLSSRERLAIVHYYVWDRSLEELARLTGVSHSTVSTWRRRGIAKLQKLITL